MPISTDTANVTSSGIKFGKDLKPAGLVPRAESR